MLLVALLSSPPLPPFRFLSSLQVLASGRLGVGDKRGYLAKAILNTATYGGGGGGGGGGGAIVRQQLR